MIRFELPSGKFYFPRISPRITLNEITTSIWCWWSIVILKKQNNQSQTFNCCRNTPYVFSFNFSQISPLGFRLSSPLGFSLLKTLMSLISKALWKSISFDNQFSQHKQDESNTIPPPFWLARGSLSTTHGKHTLSEGGGEGSHPSLYSNSISIQLTQKTIDRSNSTTQHYIDSLWPHQDGAQISHLEPLQL